MVLPLGKLERFGSRRGRGQVRQEEEAEEGVRSVQPCTYVRGRGRRRARGGIGGAGVQRGRRVKNGRGMAGIATRRRRLFREFTAKYWDEQKSNRGNRMRQRLR